MRDKDKYEKVRALLNNLNKIKRSIGLTYLEVKFSINYEGENAYSLCIVCYSMNQIRNIDYILKNKKRTLSFSLFDEIILDFHIYICLNDKLNYQEDVKNLLKNFELYEKNICISNSGFNIDIFEYLINVKELRLCKIQTENNKKDVFVKVEPIVNETILSKCKNLQVLRIEPLYFQTINFHPGFLSENKKLFSFTLGSTFTKTFSFLFLKNIFKNLSFLHLYGSAYNSPINSQELNDIMEEEIYPSLSELLISNMSLEFLPTHVYFPNLIIIELYTTLLTYDGIEYFFKRHRNVKSLKKICLSHNSQLKNFDFCYLPPNIEKFTIDICGVSFEKYRKYILQNYTKIKYLKLGKVDIENIFPYSIEGMQELTEEEEEDLSLLNLHCQLNDNFNNPHQLSGYYLYNNTKINTCKVFICYACKYKTQIIKCDCCKEFLRYYARNF